MIKKSRGFTLIELIMVIVILGVLSAVALPRYINLKAQANVAAVKGSLGAIRAAIAMYYASTATALDTPCYPGSITPDMFFDNATPREPISNLNSVYVGAGGAALNSLGGWYYIATSGLVYCNVIGYSSY